MEEAPVYKKDWVLTGEALEKLLTCLDADREVAGARYEEIRKRLRKMFECNRCPDPEELIDITFDRAARRIDEGVEIKEPVSYIITVARYVLKEYWVSPRRKTDDLDGDLQYGEAVITQPEDDEEDKDEARLECLEKCAGKLTQSQRE